MASPMMEENGGWDLLKKCSINLRKILSFREYSPK